ncbi:MAG TPA: V-type ATP synthase subunit E [Natrialbaceae archaeon]|nr:V-type ATP synthase subunit E [Natrialbaceae archaeon]
MSLETVVEDIRDEARARAEEIRAEADERAEEVVREAEADRDEILEDAEREVEQQIEQEREQKLSSAKLEAKQERLEARRDVLQEVRERVEDRLADFEDDRREELTRELLDAAMAEFDPDATIEVYGRSDDEDLLRSIVEDYDRAEYAGEYDCLGGVVVEGADSRLRVNNTFDSIIEEVWEDSLKDVSDRLFEQ